MKIPYNLYSIETFRSTDVHRQMPDGSWANARPIRYHSKWNDLKLAWLVFTRKADAFIWPEDLIKENQ